MIKNLRKHLKHNDAGRVTKKDLLTWRDHLMGDLSAKTVNDIYLSTVRSLFAWAHENDRLAENVAINVRQPKPKRQFGRERGYTATEAQQVFKAVRSYQPKDKKTGRNETPHITAAKRWCPIICAFTGARISEITQLRQDDVRQDGSRWIIRITPDAGTVKAGNHRDVALHKQIVDLGFIYFVTAAMPGPLFHAAIKPERFSTDAGSV